MQESPEEIQEPLEEFPEELLKDPEPFICHLRLHVGLTDNKGPVDATLHLSLPGIMAESPNAAAGQIKRLVELKSIPELVEMSAEAPDWTARTRDHYQALDQFTADTHRVEEVMEANPHQELAASGWSADILDAADHVVLTV